jgi:nucleoside-diphosphate-sugar epimerase
VKSILITGVTGFIGSNLVNYFKQTGGVEVYGHSRKRTSDVTLLPDTTTQTLDQYHIDTVIHLAGIAHDLSNQYKPEDYYKVNFENTKVLFDAFLKSNATKFIFLSSIKAAVDTASTAVDETVSPAPVTDYGKSKLQAEQYMLSIPLPEDKRVYIFRPCMIHGPGNKGNLNLLYRFAKTGMPYPFGAFQNQRSFLSIDNLNFIVRSCLEKEVPSGIYHLADDGFLSTQELYEIISTAIHKRPMILNIPKGMLNFLFSIIGKKAMLTKLTEDMMVSNAKVKKYIGAPLPVDMREGLRKTIQSFHVD